MNTATYLPAPVLGYFEGLVTSDRAPVPQDNNLWLEIAGVRFNVHPYRADFGGYPVRWIEGAPVTCGGVTFLTKAQAVAALAE